MSGADAITTAGPVAAERGWTEEQTRAIERRDGELLLDAGAGSGKTSVLVERFVRHVLEDDIPVAAILAITFTEKAAAELRERIRLRLRELGAHAQARATEGAFISTIHGFCARVLRSGALAAGLDPGFVVLDRDRSGPLLSDAFDAALRAQPAERAVGLLSAYDAWTLRTALGSVYGQLRSAGELRPRLPAADVAGDPGAAARLAQAVTQLGLELAAVPEPGSRVIEALARLQRCRELLQSAGAPGTAGGADPWPSELARLALPRNGAALSTDACARYSAALADYTATCAARAAGPILAAMDALLDRFGAEYEQAKRAISGVDFEDLELMCAQLLRSRPELRERYAQRFARIMVDEQQDTNRVQLELIEAIARDNLFTVGDVQQSIYRFRHADVGLFAARGRRLGAAQRRLTLQTNFRSRPEILETLNAAFAVAMGEAFTPLVPGRPAAEAGETSEPRVELLLVDKGADWELEGIAAPWRLGEARALADRVAEVVADGTTPGEIVLLTRATADMRAYERALESRGLPTYVIGGRGYWSHPQVLDLVAYLRVIANPRDEEALLAVLASPLVGVSFDALVVLCAAARARRTEPWAVLRDPGADLSPLGESDRAALTGCAAWLAAERGSAHARGIEDLIDRALERTGYDLAMLALPGGRRRLANVRKLMRLGREYERDHGPDLRGFLDTVAQRAAGGGADARESEAPVEGEGLNAIRLMTIHRAKGLEWPVVCVADLGRGPRPPSWVLRVSPEGRIGLQLRRAGDGERPTALDWKAIREADLRADEDEERRLFYVAMTRARERLILSGATRFEGWATDTKKGGGPVGWIAPALIPDFAAALAEGGGVFTAGGGRLRLRLATPEDLRDGGVEVSDAPPTGHDDPPAPPAPAVLAPPAPAAPGPPVATLSYSALAQYGRCGYRFYAERVLGLPAGDGSDVADPSLALGPDPGSDGDERPGAGDHDADADPAAPHALPGRRGAERGVLIHVLLERLNFRVPRAPGPDEVRDAARAAGLPVPDVEEAIALGAVVSAFAAGPLCARLARGPEPRREERFAFPLAGVLITGAIDVLHREPGQSTLIVDYKSDRLAGADPEGVVERAYATQRTVYALAALHAGAARVEVAYCFLECPQTPVVRIYTAEDRPGLEAALLRSAEGILRREFPVSPTPHRALCAGCPAEAGLCSWGPDMTRRVDINRLF